MKRLITEYEEQVYRLRHHNHEGLTAREVAEKLNISPERVNQILRSLKAKAPQLFPLLAKQQTKIYKLITEQGMTYPQVAAILRISPHTIEQSVKAMKTRGIHFQPRPTTRQYEPHMDENVKRKF